MAAETHEGVIVRARGLRMSFGTSEALRGVDLDVRQGEVLAIVGPSGSGKSTLLHVLAGVLPPDSGEVRVGDVAISALSDSERSLFRLNEFGFVFQFGQLLPDLSALDNVSLPLLLRGVRRRVASQRAAEWLDRLGLAEHMGRLPTELSGGQAQRAAIARALVASPRVMFADEPTGSLDSLSAEIVMEALMTQVGQSGTTVVLVTHDARTAAYADREVVVRDGVLRGAGVSISA